MEARRIVKLRNDKYAIQEGWESEKHTSGDFFGQPMLWEFMGDPASPTYTRLLFNTEKEAKDHVEAWVKENQITEICMEIYINEEN